MKMHELIVWNADQKIPYKSRYKLKDPFINAFVYKWLDLCQVFRKIIASFNLFPIGWI